MQEFCFEVSELEFTPSRTCAGPLRDVRTDRLSDEMQVDTADKSMHVEACGMFVPKSS